MTRIALARADEAPAEAQLRENIEALMEQRRMSQSQLAERLGKSQSWVSKRLSGKPQPNGARLQVEDLDALAHVFGLSPAQLLQPGHGKQDRRNGERRTSVERRHSSERFHRREPDDRNGDQPPISNPRDRQ